MANHNKQRYGAYVKLWNPFQIPILRYRITSGACRICFVSGLERYIKLYLIAFLSTEISAIKSTS